jgi:hypothetical protein
LALVASGCAYGSDDIVHIGGNGLASPISFAAAAKFGAWDLLASYVPGLGDLPIHERADGVLTRYVTPACIDRRGPLPTDIVLLLKRERGVQAHVDQLSPLEALCSLLESGYSHTRSLAAATLEGLARNLSQANCANLVYDDLASAVALIASIAHE